MLWMSAPSPGPLDLPYSCQSDFQLPLPEPVWLRVFTGLQIPRCLCLWQTGSTRELMPVASSLQLIRFGWNTHYKYSSPPPLSWAVCSTLVPRSFPQKVQLQLATVLDSTPFGLLSFPYLSPQLSYWYFCYLPKKLFTLESLSQSPLPEQRKLRLLAWTSADVPGPGS